MSTIVNNLKITKLTAFIDLAFKSTVLTVLIYAFVNKKWPFESAAEKVANARKMSAIGSGELYKPQSAIPPLLIFLLIGVLVFFSLSQITLLHKIPIFGRGLQRDQAFF